MSEKQASTPTDGPSPIGEISQEPSAFETFLDNNQKNLLIVGLVGLLAIVGYVIYDGIRTSKIEAAAAAVSSASTVPEYEAAASEFSGTNAGGSATILKAQLQWRDQQRSEAVETLKSFASDYPEHPVLGAAMTQLGRYQRDLGQLEEAKASFTAAAETESATSSQALLFLGDLARQAGQDEEARSYYNEILEKYADSHPSSKTLAQRRLKLVGVAAPSEKVAEVPAPTPTPTATTSPVKVTPKVDPAKIEVTTPTAPATPAVDLEAPVVTEEPAQEPLPETPASPTEEEPSTEE